MVQYSRDIVPSGSTPWVPLGPGISYRLLRAESDSGRFTVLIRAEAGGRLPRHRHEEAAEIFILKGRGTHPQSGPFATGDYIYEARGAVHDVVDFDHDVELLMVSHGPSSFLAPSDAVVFVMDVAMVMAGVQRA